MGDVEINSHLIYTHIVESQKIDLVPRLPLIIKILLGFFIGLFILSIISGIGSMIFTNLFLRGRLPLEQGKIIKEEEDSLFKIVPLYKDSALVSKSQSDSLTKIILKTESPVKDVSQFYEDALKNTGWSKESTLESGQTVSDTYKKENSRILISISLNSEEKNTLINITYEEHPH